MGLQLEENMPRALEMSLIIHQKKVKRVASAHIKAVQKPYKAVYSVSR